MKILRIIPVVLVTVMILSMLFGKEILNLNTTYFSPRGDGLKSYYCALYHAKYDKDARKMTGMNYPWGESIYFTDGQPPIANAVRFVDHHLFPCANKMAGIFNFMMIFSILLSSIFLFLIFKKFKMPDWYSTLLAIGLALLSPQMGRLAGHFSLSWGFWIPLLIYLTILIIEKPTWWKSILFGVITLLASLMHMYFFLFSVALMGVYILEWLFFRYDKKQLGALAAHFAIQIIVPFLLLQFLMLDDQTDRTLHPYGFFAYRGYPGSVFLPVNKWYMPFIMKLHFVHHYEWEALAYVGMVASIGFWMLFGRYLTNLFRRVNGGGSFTGDRKLDILFWASFLMLLFSFGVPFIFGLDKLRDSISFLSQLRAVGRFSWLFFYVINVIVWIKVYQYFSTLKIKKLGFSIIVLLLGILGFEAYDYSKNCAGCLNNEVPQLSDWQNHLDENHWVKEVDANRYQAIMPIPYFHIGSESSWIEARCDIDRQMFIASLKTGLPCNGVMLGRTSLSQTYKNIELSKTPWNRYRVLDEYPNNKPLLLIVAKCDDLNTDEKRLVDNATLVCQTPNFDFYELPIDTFRTIPAKYNFPQRYQSMLDSAERNKDSLTFSYIYRTGNMSKGKSEGVVVGRKFQRIMEAPVKLDPTKKCYLRFWIKNYDRDLVARTQLLVLQCTPDHKTLEETYSDIFRNIRSFNDDWALIEIPLEPKQPDEIIKLLIKNPSLKGTNLFFDEFSVLQSDF
ncbi:MAG TPA: hypothetical protein PKH79_08480 [Prolixibacteraceae bacterium]|nr:hypothetical protein [Prolixibacteraceae bacterium]